MVYSGLSELSGPGINVHLSLIIPDLLTALTDYNVRSVDEARRLMDLALTLGRDPWTDPSLWDDQPSCPLIPDFRNVRTKFKSFDKCSETD